MAPALRTDLRREWLRLQAAIESAEHKEASPILDGKSLNVSDVLAVARFEEPTLLTICFYC